MAAPGWGEGTDRKVCSCKTLGSRPQCPHLQNGRGSWGYKEGISLLKPLGDTGRLLLFCRPRPLLCSFAPWLGSQDWLPLYPPSLLPCRAPVPPLPFPPLLAGAELTAGRGSGGLTASGASSQSLGKGGGCTGCCRDCCQEAAASADGARVPEGYLCPR